MESSQRVGRSVLVSVEGIVSSYQSCSSGSKALVAIVSLLGSNSPRNYPAAAIVHASHHPLPSSRHIATEDVRFVLFMILHSNSEIGTLVDE